MKACSLASSKVRGSMRGVRQGQSSVAPRVGLNSGDPNRVVILTLFRRRLGALGYLAVSSQVICGVLGATTANVLVGLLSAMIDNVRVMFAVLQMSPDMSHDEWLLVTLTAGVGGSLLSIGSAARGGAHGPGAGGVHVRSPPCVGSGRSRWVTWQASSPTWSSIHASLTVSFLPKGAPERDGGTIVELDTTRVAMFAARELDAG